MTDSRGFFFLLDPVAFNDFQLAIVWRKLQSQASMWAPPRQGLLSPSVLVPFADEHFQESMTQAELLIMCLVSWEDRGEESECCKRLAACGMRLM